MRAVYKIVTKAGHYYIGGSMDVMKRWGTHRSKLRTGIHGNAPMTDLYRRHGMVFFSLEIVEKISDGLSKEDATRALRAVEQRLIDECFDDPYCLNVCPDASGRRGARLSQRQRARIGIGQRRRAFTVDEETGFRIGGTRSKPVVGLSPSGERFEWPSVQQLAERAGVSRNTAAAWVRSNGRMKAGMKAGWLFQFKEI